MILSTTQVNHMSITTTGETQEVEITFPFLNEKDIDVFIGTEQLTMGTEYTVVGSPDDTVIGKGKVRFGVPVPAGTRLFFIRNTDQVRLTDFDAAAYFEEKLLDAEFNNMIRQLQDSKMYLTTAPHIHPTDIGTMRTTLPPSIANGIIMVNSENDAFEYADLREHPDLLEFVRICKAEVDKAKAEADKAKASADNAKDSETIVVNIAEAFGEVAANQRIVETITLTFGQTEVQFNKVFVNASTIYINGQLVDRGRLVQGVDYNVATVTKIVLARKYAAGTQITAEQNLKQEIDRDTNPIWNRKVIDAIAHNTFVDYSDSGRLLTPRLNFNDTHYLPLFDSTTPVVFSSNPTVNSDGTISIQTDKGERRFSRFDAEAVPRVAIVNFESDINTLKTDMGSVKPDVAKLKTDINTKLDKTATAVNSEKVGGILAADVMRKDLNNTVKGNITINRDGTAEYRATAGGITARVISDGRKVYFQGGDGDANNNIAISGFNGRRAQNIDLFCVGYEGVTISGKKVYNEAFNPPMSKIADKEGFMIGAPKALTPSDNLNDIKTPGCYAQTQSGSTSGNNYPEELAGSLIVTTGAGWQQRYHVFASSRIWTRSFYKDAWGPWAQQYNTQNKPTTLDVGVAHTFMEDGETHVSLHSVISDLMVRVAVLEKALNAK